MTITPTEFVNLWAQSKVREQQGAQTHFNQLCEMVGHRTPIERDPKGEFFTFEEHVEKATGGKGRADVWYKEHFAWEYKGKHKDLDAAYAQLLAYRGGLGNPPLLVVCDFLEYRIYPQWPNTSGQPFVFHNDDLTRPDTLRYITWLLESPERFLELRQEELERREKITLELAYKFAHLADLLRSHKDSSERVVWHPIQIARFLTKLVFALFAEDVGLLPRVVSQPAFRFIINATRANPPAFIEGVQTLFKAMDGQRPDFFMMRTPYFNGGLFADSQPGVHDGIEVLDLTQIPGAIDLLEEVSEADWREVNPTIFGTLFEGALDEGKRAQLGAHYTSESDIRLVVEPVLMQPLIRQWEAVQAEAAPLLQVYLDANTPPRPAEEAKVRLLALHDQIMDTLENTRVLDPACGSGNFLYVSLRAMKDLEARVRKFFEPLRLPFRDVVTPRQLYGIEKDEFAARLAHVVGWIGYLQWRFEDKGILHPYLKETSSPLPDHLPNPIIQDKSHPGEPDRIVNDDAIMRYDADGNSYEPDWPEADVIMGNPPFLGGKRMRNELRDQYVDDLFTLYEGQVSHEADLVCYWYEKARTQLEQGKARRVGLLATNSIRGGANREALIRIKQTGDIFMAWGDRPWVLEGASVRISIIGFDSGQETNHTLDGESVATISSDLTSATDLTKACTLPENRELAFMGVTPGGPFDIPGTLARTWLTARNNDNRRPNSDVVRPYYNAMDLVRRPRDVWTIDFNDMTQDEAYQYVMPFSHVDGNVRPIREQNRRESYREKWWLYAEPRPAMRAALHPLSRYIATPMVSKHRVFCWLTPEIVPANLLNVIARDDDYFFGVLHSYLHEIWSLRLGTSLEDRPRYTPTTTFETFPFPWPPGSEDAASPLYQALADAAKQLHEERDAWLNPPDDLLNGPARAKLLRERTLTNLYNALEAYRNRGNGETNNGPRKAQTAAQVFAPRLSQLHDALDRAVLAAYGWGDISATPPPDPLPVHVEGEHSSIYVLRTAEGDEELLRRLLALNLQRAAS